VSLREAAARLREAASFFFQFQERPMKVRPTTSRDAKEARNALLKQLADLPLSNMRTIKTSPRKPVVARAEPEKVAAKA
jgi:hypothetical protein